MERIRVALWPRRSFMRSARYFSKRVLRLSASPHTVAAGVASGVFATFLPFPGFHFILAAIFAFLIAGNVLASALGTAVGNPLTFPFIWASTFEVGRFILDGRGPRLMEPVGLGEAFRSLEFGLLWAPLLKPMIVGGVPLGLGFALIAYLSTRRATAAFRRQRRMRLAERARRRAEGTDLARGAVRG